MTTLISSSLGLLLFLFHFSSSSWDDFFISIDGLESCDGETNMRFSNIFLDHGANNDVKLSLNLDIDHDIEGPIMMEADIKIKNDKSKNQWNHYINKKESNICPLLADKKSILSQVMVILGFNQICPIKAGHYERKEEPFALSEDVEKKLKGADYWKITIKFFKKKKPTYELCAELLLKVNYKTSKSKNWAFVPANK